MTTAADRDGGWSVSDLAVRVAGGHKYLIALCAVLGLVGALAVAQTLTPTYRASTEVVTGTYTVPADLRQQETFVGAGPLGLELPAETQARIVSSPIIVSMAADSLSLDENQSRALLESVRVSPNTDNVFTISAAGPSPQAAADNANAVAAAFLDYRDMSAAAKLLPLRDDALADADAALAHAAELEDEAAQAESDGETALATRLSVQQAEQLQLVESHGARARSIGTMLQTFDGGGQVVRPADPGSASGGTARVRLALAGLLAGLVVGVAIAVVIEKFRLPLRSARDVAVGGRETVVADLGDQATSPVVVALQLSRRREARRAHDLRIAVIPLRRDSPAAGMRDWLAGGFQSLGMAPALRDADTDGTTTEESPAVFLADFADVPTLCLQTAHDSTPDQVVLVATRGLDSVTQLRDVAATLQGAGLQVAAVLLTQPSRRPSRPWRRAPSHAGSVTDGPVGDRTVDLVAGSENETAPHTGETQKSGTSVWRMVSVGRQVG